MLDEFQVASVRGKVQTGPPEMPANVHASAARWLAGFPRAPGSTRGAFFLPRAALSHAQRVQRVVRVASVPVPPLSRRVFFRLVILGVVVPGIRRLVR